MDHAPRRRLAHLFSLDEAQLILDEIPSDNEVNTDEEPDSDSDDPTFQPDPLGLQTINAEDGGGSNGDETGSSDEQPDVPSTSKAKKKPEPKRHWKKKNVTAKASQFDSPEGMLQIVCVIQAIHNTCVTKQLAQKDNFSQCIMGKCH